MTVARLVLERAERGLFVARWRARFGDDDSNWGRHADAFWEARGRAIAAREAWRAGVTALQRAREKNFVGDFD